MFEVHRETSPIVVNVLNMTAFSKTVVAYLIGNGIDLNGVTCLKPYAPLGIAEGKNGKHYLIDTEGCGSGVALEDERESIGWYRETFNKEDNSTSFDMFPFVEVKFDKEELNEVSIERKETLDKFVRISGGDRLERNFRNWEKFLITGIEPKY